MVEGGSFCLPTIGGPTPYIYYIQVNINNVLKRDICTQKGSGNFSISQLIFKKNTLSNMFNRIISRKTEIVCLYIIIMHYTELS